MNQELVNEIVFSVCGKHPLELRKMTYRRNNQLTNSVRRLEKAIKEWVENI